MFCPVVCPHNSDTVSLTTYARTMITRRTAGAGRIGALLAACVGAVLFPSVADAQLSGWKQTAGPEGGMFRTIAATQNTIVGVIGNDGVSRLEGGTWTRISDFTPTQLIPAGDVLIGVRQGTQHPMEYYRSTDKGTTWEPVGIFSDFSAAVSVAGESIYALRNDTLFVSNDGLVTLEPLSVLPQFSVPPIGRSDLLLRGGGFFSDTVYRSVDGGRTWEPLETGLPAAGSGGRMLAGGSETFYAAGTGSTVYRTTDGTTWEQVGAGLPENGWIDWIAANDRAAFVSINSGNVYYLEGETWKPVDVPGYPLQGTLDGDRLLLPTNSGAYALSRDGSSFTALSAGLRNMTVNALQGVGNAMFAATLMGVHRSTDDGATWELVHDEYAGAFESHGETLFAVAGGDILRSTDLGASWTFMQGRFDNIKMARWGTTEFSLPFSGITAADDGTLYITVSETFSEHGVSSWRDGGVFRSDDNGDTWQEVSVGLPHDGFTYIPVNDAIALDDGVVFISTINGIFRSRNRGNGWGLMQSGLPSGDEPIFTGTFFELKGSVYLHTSTGLYRADRSGNGGWESVPNLPIEGQYWYTTGDRGNIVGDKLYVPVSVWDGTQLVFHVYTFDGNAWEDVTDQMPAGVPMNAFAGTDRTMFGGSQGRSVWARTLEVSGVEESERYAGSVRVLPNPTADEICVHIEAKEEGAEGTITLTDMLGKTVAVLHQGRVRAGRSAYRFDATGLPAGAYVVQVLVDGKRSESLVIRR